MFTCRGRPFLRVCKRLSSDEASVSPNFVPVHQPVQERQLNELSRLLSGCRRLVALTGAGISTESGIPDYRSRGVGLYATDSHRRPVQYSDFVRDPSTRQRYWARNFAGWPRFSSVAPNAAHRALGLLDERPFSEFTLVTQNVDRLHGKAGSRRVVELHGSAYEVVCMKCGRTTDRHLVQTQIARLNARLPIVRETVHRMAPDGDVHLSDEAVKSFRVPNCDVCEGILKPDMVFFGDSVPRATVDAVYDRVRRCDALLVAGSSLQVYSGYRFVLEAHERKIPIAIVNIGPTRADHLATCIVNSSCGQVLPRVVEEVLAYYGI